MLLAHLHVIDNEGQRTLSAIAFFLASPALLFTVLQESDIARFFSGNLVAISAGVVCTLSATLVVGVLRRDEWGRTVVAAMCSSYCNAANLGLPIAAYVLGNTALIASILFLQLLVCYSPSRSPS